MGNPQSPTPLQIDDYIEVGIVKESSNRNFMRNVHVIILDAKPGRER